MTHAAIVARVVLLVAAVLGVTFVISGMLFHRMTDAPHPAAVITWLVFGGGVTALGRIVPRAATLGAAGLLGLVALVDLAVPLLNVIGGRTVGWISASEYTWIAIAILAANGLVADRSTAPRERPA